MEKWQDPYKKSNNGISGGMSKKENTDMFVPVPKLCRSKCLQTSVKKLCVILNFLRVSKEYASKENEKVKKRKVKHSQLCAVVSDSRRPYGRASVHG